MFQLSFLVILTQYPAFHWHGVVMVLEIAQIILMKRIVAILFVLLEHSHAKINIAFILHGAVMGRMIVQIILMKSIVVSMCVCVCVCVCVEALVV